MKISAAIATAAISGRPPGEVDLVDRISQFIAETPHAFLGSGAFLALGRRLAAAGVKPVDGEQVDITPFARSISVAEAKEALQRAASRSTFERVVSVVAVQGEVRPDRISPETALDKIGFDSLGLVELVLAMEEHFEISIPEDMKELETVKTVEDIAQVVEKVLGRPAAPLPAAPTSANHTQLGLPTIEQPNNQLTSLALETSALSDKLWSYNTSEFRNYASAESVAAFITSRYHLTPR
jgi:acyl carrier protein